MTRLVEPPSSVLLLVGREEFTPPSTFGGQTAVATHDCVAVVVFPIDDGPTSVTLAPQPARGGLVRLGEFLVESEGQLSLRDIYSREYEAIGLDAGPCVVVVWGNHDSEPDEVAFEVRTSQPGPCRHRRRSAPRGWGGAAVAGWSGAPSKGT